MSNRYRGSRLAHFGIGRMGGRGQRVTIERGVMADVVARYQFSCDKFDYVTVDGLVARVVKIPLGGLAAA